MAGLRGPIKQTERGPRHATHPINAILNYGYSMLAGQVERAAVIRGLDVAVGSLHADSDGRRSLVYDLIDGPCPLSSLRSRYVASERQRPSRALAHQAPAGGGRGGGVVCGGGDGEGRRRVKRTGRTPVPSRPAVKPSPLTNRKK
ncbi:MAG: CRISPR-associated endonuclease Cas1 [Gammaproteobacteria bacterium]